MVKIDEKRRFFGITLSQRAWNNILVYAILLLMVVFYVIAPGNVQKVSQQAEQLEPMQLMPSDVRLQQIRIADRVYLNSPQGWVCQAPCSVSQQAAQNLAQHWLNLSITKTEKVGARITDVELRFAEQAPVKVTLFQAEHPVIWLPRQQQAYTILSADISQLLGQ
ncbi:hypothetical protein CWI84_03245 [Idiomarina tyrosinivorans]|uniref:DUF4340 domain-containing protein n=1 Tax=Idiomarina tyrosinivorans TaxID=1445662 RepID=A0A432ZT95_9GAMM|nr:hypothetical protein [Idiomarina tyrosinivorans]RUO81140.1 hypothetical protein CWI84_03245 [Idiomarina tyrosinivorans]